MTRLLLALALIAAPICPQLGTSATAQEIAPEASGYLDAYGQWHVLRGPLDYVYANYGYGWVLVDVRPVSVLPT